MNKKLFAFRSTFLSLSLAVKLTVAGLVGCTLAISIQWLSGDPAYPKFPPGIFFFVVIAAIVAYGARWWWTPLVGGLISLFATAGWFARLHAEMQRLTHPARIGRFAIGIFVGTLLLIAALATTDIAALVATFQNFRRRKSGADGPRVVLGVFGALFLLMGLRLIIGRAQVDSYSVVQLTWGVLAIGVSVAGMKMTKLFCLGSGAFYLALGLLGVALGNPADHLAWYAGPIPLQIGDHIFHLVVGAVLLGVGMIPQRRTASLHSTA